LESYYVVIALIIGAIIGAIIAWKKYKWLTKEEVLAIINEAIKADEELLKNPELTDKQRIAAKGKIAGLTLLKEAIEKGILVRKEFEASWLKAVR